MVPHVGGTDILTQQYVKLLDGAASAMFPADQGSCFGSFNRIKCSIDVQVGTWTASVQYTSFTSIGSARRARDGE
jgi:hypothetical protein